MVALLPHHTSPILNTPHAFFTRKGGVSAGIYASLNAGVGSGDNPAHVEENRVRIAKFFGKDACHLATLRQTHSTTCITVEAGYDTASRPEADALVTREAGVILGVLTADCVPILFHDPMHHVIGAAHAGWKGAIAGIVQATVQAMVALGSAPTNIRASIGASIAQASYEVNDTFKAQFLAQSLAHAKFFLPSPVRPDTHFLYDNTAYVYHALSDTGIEHISVLPHDTYADEAQYYSFRRATHCAEENYGRQLSCITIPLKDA
jgi:polyphenol oxidase